MKDSAARAQHRFEEHTGEVRLELTAPSCEELFAEAGRALAELMLEGEGVVPPSAPGRVVEVHARDRAALLVEWLNELIFLSEISKQVFPRVQVERVDETHARGRVAGLFPETLKTAVKAATLHGVRVECSGGRWRGSVVLDV